jgi:small ligand-binding sensory domain FIST
MTRPHHDVGPHEAAAALESIGESRAEVADRLVTPVWYHPVLGLLAGGLIASAEAHRWWVVLSALVVYAVGCAVLVSSYRKLTGIWVSGLRRGPAGRVSLWLMAGLYAVAGLAALLDLGVGLRGAFVVGGVVAVGASTRHWAPS